MFDSWLFLTLLVTLSIGIVAFINKVFAEKKYNIPFSAFILYAILFIFSLISWYIFGFSSLKEIGYLHVLLSVFWWAQIFLYSLIMMNALKHLPTSTFFITVRLASSFLLLIIWIFLFWDVISLKEWWWFVLWIIAMSLLFEGEKGKDHNIKLGIILLFLWITALVFWHTSTKILSLQAVHFPTILLITFAAAFFTSLAWAYPHIHKNIQYTREIFQINFIQAIFYFTYFYVLFYVYQSGNLWISYKIQSYSPFIPIVLSAIVYKEKLSLQKKIAIVFTLTSLYFFT